MISRKQEQSRLRSRRHRLRTAYGITLDQYAAMLVEQRGGCAICRQTCPTGQHLAVDHDHKTGAVRGLLCFGHNTGMGKFNDDPELLRRAADYLELHRKPL